MTTNQWQRVEELFNNAADLPQAEREAWLEQQCAGDAALLERVRSLLASDSEANGFLENQIAGGVMQFHAVDSRQQTRRAGPYILTEVLGRGGMGTVYLGQRADGEYQGEVAVKLVRPGMDTDFFLARFKRERQAMARLQHPNIARLLDSGTTEEGIPYIVMERVTGEPVNAYCRQNKLTVPEILKLYIPVCRAVAHAHRNFIVHRDLKPGNILVQPDGTPKLLDFGICKLLLGGPAPDDTVDGVQMMTPDYASPEQICADPVTVSSDVYSLGAVLYELLTGQRPHSIGKYTPQEILKSVCESEVRRPSTVAAGNRSLARELSGDLDTILLKAMQREPERRYESAEQLAEDLERVIQHEPVHARPDTALYVVGKFARRNRIPVVMAVLLAVALSVGMVSTAIQASLARSEAAQSRKLANAMVFDIHDRIRQLPGSLPARQAIIKLGLDHFDRLAATAGTNPELRKDLAGAYLRMGQVQGSVLGSYTGDTSAALESYRKGAAALEGVTGSVDADLLRIDLYRAEGQVLETRKPAEAIKLFEAALPIATALYQKSPDDVAIARRLADVFQSSATTLRRLERFETALDSMSRSRDIFAKLLLRNPTDKDVLIGLSATTSLVGALQFRLNRLEEARKSMEDAVKQSEELCRLDPSNSAMQRDRMLAYSHLGDLLGNPNYQNMGDVPGAIAAFDSMLAVAANMYQANPGDLGPKIDYGMSLGRVAGLPLRAVPERLDLYRRSMALLGDALQKDAKNGNVRVNLAFYRDLYGDLLAQNGQKAAAFEQYRQVLHDFEVHPPTIPSSLRVIIISARKLAEEVARNGNDKHAFALLEKAKAIQAKANIPGTTVSKAILSARLDSAYGSVHRILGHSEEAMRLNLRALEMMRSVEKLPDFNKLMLAELKQLETVTKTPPMRAKR